MGHRLGEYKGDDPTQTVEEIAHVLHRFFVASRVWGVALKPGKTTTPPLPDLAIAGIRFAVASRKDVATVIRLGLVALGETRDAARKIASATR